MTRRPVPWQLLGWGGFACLVGAATTVWATGSWSIAALVVAAGVLGLGAVALMTWATPARRTARATTGLPTRAGDPPSSP